MPSSASRKSLLGRLPSWFWPTLALVAVLGPNAIAMVLAVLDIKVGLAQLVQDQQQSRSSPPSAEPSPVTFTQTIVMGQQPTPATSRVAAGSPLAPRTAPKELAELVGVVGTSAALKQRAECEVGTVGMPEFQACLRGAVAFAVAPREPLRPASQPTASSVVAVNVASPTVSLQQVATTGPDPQPKAAVPVSFAPATEDEPAQDVAAEGSIQGYRVTIFGGHADRPGRAALVGPNGERIDDVQVGSIIGDRGARVIAVSEDGVRVLEDGNVFASNGEDAFQPTNVESVQEVLANTAAW